MLWTKANIVTFIRIIMLYTIITFLASRIDFLLQSTLILIPLIYFLDYVDGYVARVYKEETLFGSMFDVIGDRMIEILMWLTFLFLGMVPLWAPVVMISRGFVTDTIRLRAQREGKTVYGMLEQKFSKIFVSSKFSRGVSGLSKAALFTLLAYVLAFNISNLGLIIDALIVFVVLWNIVRGVPVFIEGWRYVSGEATEIIPKQQ